MKRWGLVLPLLLWLYAYPLEAAQTSITIGSFHNVYNAKALARQSERHLKRPVSTRSVTTLNPVLYRVVILLAPTSNARQQLADIRDRGYPDAWLWVERTEVDSVLDEASPVNVSSARQSARGTIDIQSRSTAAPYSFVNEETESRHATLETSLNGFMEPQFQWFVDQALTDTNATNASVATQITFEAFWGRSKWLVFTPFARLDEQDPQRTHVDVRELKYAQTFGHWQIDLGIDKVFWGVTESVHLIDIINQTDFVESIDGEEKLGQPMLRVSTTWQWGTFDAYLLPYFRERTFGSFFGSPGNGIRIDVDNPLYEHDREREHLDFSIRYSHIVQDWDFGVSYFRGTGRAPILELAIDVSGEPILVPLYPQIRQVSLDLQATKGAWLFKFEGLQRHELDDEYEAAVSGFEYTLYSLFDSPADLGLLAEYMYDSRGRSSPTPFNNDTFIGVRWALNDTQSSSLLLGAVIDMDSHANSIFVEAERRIADAMRISLEGRWFSHIPSLDPLAAFADFDFLQLSITHYF